MSSSSNGYSTKPVSEKGAGGQGDCVPGIGDKLRKQLGIGPDSGREEGSEPLVALPQSIKGAPFNCGILKEIILDQSNTVKIRPVLLTVSGLQESGDTHAITHLMKHYVDKSPYTPISRKTYIPKTAKGIINYKLVAVGLHRLQIVEMTSDFSYAFGIMFAFQKKVQDKENPEFPLFDSNTRNEKNASFGDPDLEMHLENVYRHISQFEHFPKGSPTQSDKSVESIIDKLTGEEKALLQHLQKLPDGAALINIWSVDIRKSAFYILHALFGYLYNSNTWLFIDIQQNLKELDDPLKEKQQNDGSFIVKWRSRLHYLLHASKMSHGGCKGYRTQVCTFFAKHDKGNLQIKQDELEEKVHQGARQTGVSDLLEPQVQVISLSDSQISDDDSQKLYQKFHQVLCNRTYEEIPFSWVFLRSLFDYSHKVYISKTALKEKAKECGIIDESFEKFCHFFMSFGSIIDLTCINPEQKIVVLAPVEFLRSLDKIFYPSDEISKQYPMIINGVVSDKVCKEIFEQEGEWAVYIDVLMSIGLAAKVTGVCEIKDIKIGSKQRNDALYYIPLIREEVISSPDEIQGANNAVYFIASPDSPHIYKQARLAKFILIDPELAHSELIPCHQKNRTIIRVVYGSTDTTITFVSFSPATLITITENNESKSNDDELFKIYARVIKAFEYITKTGKAGLIKYQFITICSKESEDSDPNKPLYQHVLPNSLCKLCKSHGRLERELKLWNEALKKNPIPDKNKINEGKEVMAGENVKLLQVKITELQKSKETLQEQKKALLLENENLKSLLEGKTRTQKNEEINNEVNVQPHSMKEGDTDATHDSELLSTSTKSLQEKEHIQYSDDDTQFAGIEDKATTKTSDKEVQFNYLVPSEDHLDGLSDSHIAGKKLFLVQGDKPQLMNWEEYGLRISVPEGSLSSSETTEIAVIALVGGHFKFPKNTRLVSAVYAISASHLLNSLKLEVQHCIDLSDPSLCKYLKFAVAPVHTSSLPYQFSIVEGGEFPANSRYGSIERSKFCLLTIVLGRSTSCSTRSTSCTSEAIIYAGQVFYANKNLMRFTAARDLNALYRYIKKEYYRSEIDQRNILFKIDPSLGYVELVFDGPQSKPITGWSVHPHSEPCRIYEDEMLHEISSTHPPTCLVSIDAENSSTTVPMLKYSVLLKGALNVTDLKPINIVIIRSLSDILSGEFPANSRYGSIERSKFCLLGIVGEEENGEQGNGEQSNGEQEQNNGEQSNGEQEQSNGEQMCNRQERVHSENESVCGKVNGEKEHLHKGRRQQQQGDRQKSQTGYGFQIVLQNINGPDLRDHDKNEVEAEEMSEDDVSIYSSIIEDETPFHYTLEVEECAALELSQFEISPNQMNKRPREDECDDDALLPSVKKPHTDFSDLLGLTGEDKEQSNEQEGEESSRDDGESGDEGGKGGEKKREVQGQQGEEGGGAGQHKGGAGPHSGGEGGGIELNQQQQESLQQEGADEQMEQYQDGEDEEDEVKSKAEGKKVQDKVAPIAEAITYAGLVFYEQKDLMIFTAGKDLNVLREYIERKYRHAKIDQGITFKLDPSLGYVELIFNSPQEEPITGWSIYPHMNPCRISEFDMVGFEGIGNTHPPSRLITIDVEDNPTTVRRLRYSIPLKGALDCNDMHQTMKIAIIRSLKDILSGTSSGTTIAPAALPGSSDPNIGMCAVNALKKHSGSLKRLFSIIEANFRDVAGACKEINMIDSTEYDEIFDDTNRRSLSERADQFIEGLILIIELCPDQLDVFLHILKEKGNVAFIRVAERVAQSFNTEVPDQYHIILTES